MPRISLRIRRHAFFLAATSIAFAVSCVAQDSPSLGDLARQQRQQKDQSKAATEKNLKSVKVITNEQIPEHPEAAQFNNVRLTPTEEPSSENKIPAAHWKSQILMLKNQIVSLQSQADQLNESIRFAPANCAANCVGWNERQREKQQQVERLQAQLQEQKRRLDEMQDAARRQGYGSSVYDP